MAERPGKRITDYAVGQIWRQGDHRMRVRTVVDGCVFGDVSNDGGLTYNDSIAFKPEECIFGKYAELATNQLASGLPAGE